MKLAAAAIPLMLIASGCARDETDTTATAPADTTVPATDTTGVPGVGAITTASLPEFVQKAALTDMFEIEASKIAQQRATSPAIKTFARQMVSDHTATSAQLKSVLASTSDAPPVPAQLDQAHMDRIARLRAASAAEFDGLYLDQQTEVHENALNLLQAYAQNGDNAQVKAFAAQTAPKVSQHLEMVRGMDRQGADDTKKS